MAVTAIRFLIPQALTVPVILLILRASAAGIASDTLYNDANITDGQTLISTGGSFTLGFFSLSGAPTKRYVGIWFTADANAVCWVANRGNPLNTTTGTLMISRAGSLRLINGSGHTAWSRNATGASSTSAVVAQLLESGNLVVREQGSEGVLWQSFDHPSNTLLAGQTQGKNPQTGAESSLTSWRAPDDPSQGEYRQFLDTRVLPEGVSWSGGVKKYRAGPWNGLGFCGVPETASYSAFVSIQVVNEIAYIFTPKPDAPFSRLVLNEAGVLERLAWDPASREWTVIMRAPRDVCDSYAMCGAFGLCAVDTATTQYCSCLQGFSPASPSQWLIRGTAGGCRRNAALKCRNGTTTDGFVPVKGVKLPDTDNATVDMSATLEQCRERCLANCSCVAYAAADISGGGDGSGCIMWTTDIVDVRIVDDGQDLYLRLAKSELV